LPGLPAETPEAPLLSVLTVNYFSFFSEQPSGCEDEKNAITFFELSKIIRLETLEELVSVLHVASGHQTRTARKPRQDSSSSDRSSGCEDEKTSSEFFEFRQVIRPGG
jgi:hypothetical protein